jgi:hypothetical protein
VDGSAPGAPAVSTRAAAGRALPHPEEMSSPFAPSGVFFLVSRASVETDSGVFNYLPGSKVLKSGSRYITFDGKQLNLRADQITNDLRIATKLAGNDPKLLAGIQASIRNTLATPNFMPAPAKEPQTFARPALERGERKTDRSRR